MNSPIIVAVGGFASDVGKTTLMCRLLNAFPEWEAIKTTRGHYRSCGKDPHTCCVSHLLGDEPIIRSGRQQTYTAGKDTGRYWDAGAKNVHWLIAAEDQVEKGIKQALVRVESEAVLIEGNSFTQFVDVDYLVMVANRSNLRIKSSAKRALRETSALYVWGELESQDESTLFSEWLDRAGLNAQLTDVPVYGPESFSQLVSDLRRINLQPAKIADSLKAAHSQ